MYTMLDKKMTCIIAYSGIIAGALGFVPSVFGALCLFVPLIMWAIAFIFGDKNASLLHLYQSLIFVAVGFLMGIIGFILSFVPILGVIFKILQLLVWLATLAGSIWAVVTIFQGKEQKLPIIGDIKIIK